MLRKIERVLSILLELLLGSNWLQLPLVEGLALLQTIRIKHQQLVFSLPPESLDVKLNSLQKVPAALNVGDKQPGFRFKCSEKLAVELRVLDLRL